MFDCVADLYDDHALPATAAQSLLCKAARKRKEVRSSVLVQVNMEQALRCFIHRHSQVFHHTESNLCASLLAGTSPDDGVLSPDTDGPLF